MGADRSPGWALVGHRQQAVRAGELVEENPASPIVPRLVEVKLEPLRHRSESWLTHLAGVDGKLYEHPARTHHVGVGGEVVIKNKNV